MDTERYIIQNGNILVVKSGVEYINQDEFKDFDKIVRVILPRTIRYIEHGAFHGCKRLRSINIPSGVRFIKSWAFAGCESLTEIELPEGLTRVESDTFHRCIKLKKVHLPSTLQVLVEEAFSDCTSLKEIVVPSGTEMRVKRLLGYVWTPFDKCDALEKVIIRDVQPRVNKNEVKKLVFLERPQYHSSGLLYGAIIAVEPDEYVEDYMRQVVKDYLFDSFRCTTLYLDWEEDRDFGHCDPLSKVLEYDKQRFAVADLPKGATPKTIQVDGRVYLADEDFFRTTVDGSGIEWIQLIGK